jgi:hypothetical protein
MYAYRAYASAYYVQSAPIALWLQLVVVLRRRIVEVSESAAFARSLVSPSGSANASDRASSHFTD